MNKHFEAKDQLAKSKFAVDDGKMVSALCIQYP
jgi:hypothetical protein